MSVNIYLHKKKISLHKMCRAKHLKWEVVQGRKVYWYKYAKKTHGIYWLHVYDTITRHLELNIHHIF